MEDIEKYMYGKIANQEAYYIRPMSWAGIWNKDNELRQGNYIGLFNELEDAKLICEQLNMAVELKAQIDEARKYIAKWDEEYRDICLEHRPDISEPLKQILDSKGE